MSQTQKTSSDVEAARARWLEASQAASKLAAELFQPGSGYGDPDARAADEHRLQSARLIAERLFCEYHDLDRRDMELKMLDLQRSQRLATWASFAVAAVVGLTDDGQHVNCFIQMRRCALMCNLRIPTTKVSPNNRLHLTARRADAEPER